jgi:hypothetical protein
MSIRRTLALLAVPAMAALIFVAPVGAQILPDAVFTVTVSKTVVGVDETGDFDFELECASDDGIGEASFVSIDDPTFPGFEPSDSVSFSLAAGEETSFEVFVEFSRDTVITCRVDEVGVPSTIDLTTVSCDDDFLIVCADPTDGAIATQNFGIATLDWADVNEVLDFQGDPVGDATFGFTNTYLPATTVTTAPAPRAAAATPRFTG